MLAEIEQHHNLSATYDLVPRSTASSNKDSDKSKQGGSKAGGGKDTKSTPCSGCGGTYHTLDKCLFREHPDFNKSGSWEKSTALTKLKTKYPDDESRRKLNRKYRIDGTPLEKPIELPNKADKHKGKKGTKVPHDDDDDDTPVTHIVAAADAAADSTMYRECVITTNASNCRVVKVLFDTGSIPYNFIREEIAEWIEAEELKLPNDCYLSTEERRQQTTVSLAGTGSHTVVSSKNVVFNLLLFNEIKQTTELLPCLIARSIHTSIDLIIGLPTIRKHDLVLKIPSHFTSNTSDGFADIFTSSTPAGINLFGTRHRPSGTENLCTTCCAPSGHNKLSRNLTRLRNLTLIRNLTLSRNLTISRKFTLKFFQNFRGKETRSRGLESCVKSMMLSEFR